MQNYNSQNFLKFEKRKAKEKREKNVLSINEGWGEIEKYGQDNVFLTYKENCWEKDHSVK